jgi:UDP-N-acetylmuramyl pentapeptide synthase
MPEALWTADEIAAATGGQVIQDFEATGVSIDSRSIEPGDLFVALTGARDGHEFVVQTADKGAAGALVSKPVAARPCWSRTPSGAWSTWASPPASARPRPGAAR